MKGPYFGMVGFPMWQIHSQTLAQVQVTIFCMLSLGRFYFYGKKSDGKDQFLIGEILWTMKRRNHEATKSYFKMFEAAR
jgi:hypothetical protein